MPRVKSNALYVAALFFLLISLNIGPVSAQDNVGLYGVFPQRGAVGADVELLLNGDGLDGLGELIGVNISGQEVPLLDYEVISDHYIRVAIVIPEQIEITGETQISFNFANNELGAFYQVIESGDQEISPVIRQLSPHEGEVNSEVRLVFEGARLSELGELGGLIIGNTGIPVIDYGLESDESLFIAIYLPPDMPPGETEIVAYFANYIYPDSFSVRRSEPVGPEPPLLYRISPQEGGVDSEMELVLEGERFFDLGALLRVTIADVDIPILAHTTESDGLMVVKVYLPPELPAGESGITFFFENFEFNDIFLVSEAEQGPGEPRFPRIFTLDPRKGEVGTQLDLSLQGENFFALGDLKGITIGGFDLPVLNYRVESDSSLLISTFLPEDTPRGEQSIAFSFENAEFEDNFSVTAPSNFPKWKIWVDVLVGVGGFVGGRLTGRSNGKKGPERKDDRGKEDGDAEPDWRPPRVEIKVDMDPGKVIVECDEPSLKKDFGIDFEVETDDGKPLIENIEGSSIIRKE